MVVMCITLLASDAKSVFMCLMAIWILAFVKRLIKSF